MGFLQKLFGKGKAQAEAPVRSISMAPGQSQAEQDSSRSRMEAEMTASRATRFAETASLIACPHTVLAPRWDNAQDMGHEDRATAFTCNACDQSFTPEEVRTLRSTESERLSTELDLDAAKEA